MSLQLKKKWKVKTVREAKKLERRFWSESKTLRRAEAVRERVAAHNRLTATEARSAIAAKERAAAEHYTPQGNGSEPRKVLRSYGLTEVDDRGNVHPPKEPYEMQIEDLPSYGTPGSGKTCGSVPKEPDSLRLFKILSELIECVRRMQ